MENDTMRYRTEKILARSRAAAIPCVVAATIALAGSLAFGAPLAIPLYLANFPNFAPILTPQLPGDVDITLKTKLEKAGQFPQVQREFDLNAWQMFLSVNWPTNNQKSARVADYGHELRRAAVDAVAQQQHDFPGQRRAAGGLRPTAGRAPAGRDP
jgi:hypothetical protein